MPRKFFEYLATGLPVVAANVPTLRNIIGSTGCGVLVDPNSPKSIADGIIRLTSSQSLRKEFGDHGRMSCENKYNWHNESKKLQELFASLVSSESTVRGKFLMFSFKLNNFQQFILNPFLCGHW